MPRFKYRAFDDTGNFVESEVNYPSQEALIADLQQRGLSIIEVIEADKEEVKRGLTFKLPIGGRVSDRDLSIFCRQLGTMINAGLSIVDALNILGDQLPNKKLAEASKKVAVMVSEGKPISNSMAEFPAVFPEFVINLVRVG